MSTEMITVRVRDFFFGDDDEPLKNAETGAPLRNHIPYFTGTVAYYPGESFDLPRKIAEAELRAVNPQYPPALELLAVHESREERRQARAKKQREAGRSEIPDEMKRLARSADAMARMRRLADEKEFAGALDRAPSRVVEAVLERYGAQHDRHQEEMKAAKEEVPASVMERLTALEKAMQAKDAEIERLRAERAPRRQPAQREG